MVGVLTAAVVVLAAIVVLNLALTLAVIRRLRVMSAASADPVTSGPGGPAVGTIAPAFTARGPHGSVVNGPALDARTTLLGFFTTSCDACAEVAPTFARHARELGRGGATALAVIEVVGADDPTEMIRMLGSDATVVTEIGPGPVLGEFQPRGTPSFYLIDRDGTVMSSSYSVVGCLKQVKAAVSV
jgi:thiol-disulfide isomerase/thioredoxin